MEVISTNALISINATFFVQLISFLIFILVLNKFMVRPLRRISNKRILLINNIKIEIDITKKHLENIAAELEEKRLKVVTDSNLIIKKMNHKVNNEIKILHEKTRFKVTSLQKTTDKEIQKHVKQLKNDLNKNIDDIATTITEVFLKGVKKNGSN